MPERTYGRGYALLRLMGWREGEGAGKRKDGLSSASIIASTTRPHQTGLGLGARPEEAKRRTKKKKKQPKKPDERSCRRDAAEPHSSVPRVADAAPSTTSLAEHAPRLLSVGRGRARVLPSWLSDSQAAQAMARGATP